MSAGTKVTVAIVVLFAAVLGIYYGFGGPDGTGAMPADLLPPAEQEPAVVAGSVDETAAAPVNRTRAGSDLARSIEEALWAQGGTTTDDPAVEGALASDGGGARSTLR